MVTHIGFLFTKPRSWFHGNMNKLHTCLLLGTSVYLTTNTDLCMSKHCLPFQHCCLVWSLKLQGLEHSNPSLPLSRIQLLSMKSRTSILPQLYSTFILNVGMSPWNFPEILVLSSQLHWSMLCKGKVFWASSGYMWREREWIALTRSSLALPSP